MRRCRWSAEGHIPGGSCTPCTARCGPVAPTGRLAGDSSLTRPAVSRGLPRPRGAHRGRGPPLLSQWLLPQLSRPRLPRASPPGLAAAAAAAAAMAVPEVPTLEVPFTWGRRAPSRGQSASEPWTRQRTPRSKPTYPPPPPPTNRNVLGDAPCTQTPSVSRPSRRCTPITSVTAIT